MRFHHLGFIVKSIEQYEKGLLFEAKIMETFDPVQKAKLSLYSNFDTSFIELIEPLEPSSFTWNSLQTKGNHFHHLGYEVNNMNEILLLQQRYNWINILKPVPAVLFNNRLITFYLTRNRQIIELIISQE